LERAREIVLKWLKPRLPGRLPDEATRGASFEFEMPGFRVEAVSMAESRDWTLRFEHVDRPFPNEPVVSGQVWFTDVAISVNSTGLHAAVRTQVATSKGTDERVELTRPRVVVDLIEGLELRDVRRLRAEPWILGHEDDVLELVELLCDRERRLPVIVLTQPDQERLGLTTHPFLLDPDRLAREMEGIAHVAAVPWQLTYKLTELMGRSWSVYLGAVRTYHPDLDLENDAPWQHPVAFADRIFFWMDADGVRMGEEVFTEFLTTRIRQQSAARRLDFGPVLFVSDARAAVAEQARAQATNAEQWLAALEEENGLFQAANQELKKRLEDSEESRLAAQRDVERLMAENRKLLTALEKERRRKETGGDPGADEFPGGYDELPEWVYENLVGRLELLPRAVRALKDARYRDPAAVYRALLLLANEYRDSRLGKAGSQKAFERKLVEQHLELSGSISKELAGEHGETYFVKWPGANSPRRFVDLHLKRGTSRNPDDCLRVYFFWDEESSQVVVASLPAHLETRAT
jgi:hypothetical protein